MNSKNDLLDFFQLHLKNLKVEDKSQIFKAKSIRDDQQCIFFDLEARGSEDSICSYSDWDKYDSNDHPDYPINVLLKEAAVRERQDEETWRTVRRRNQ